MSRTSRSSSTINTRPLAKAPTSAPRTAAAASRADYRAARAPPGIFPARLHGDNKLFPIRKIADTRGA
jgi:hypothetical protein